MELNPPPFTFLLAKLPYITFDAHNRCSMQQMFIQSPKWIYRLELYSGDFRELSRLVLLYTGKKDNRQ